MLRLLKTGTYWICHITVAFSLAYLLTRNWHAALAIGLLEPTVQALVFYLHEVAWDRSQIRRTEGDRGAPIAVPKPAAAATC
jgi:uncharacterized membrane protein